MSYLLQNWVFTSCDKEREHENQCGVGSGGGGGVPRDSKGGEGAQLPTGAHISSVIIVIKNKIK